MGQISRHGKVLDDSCLGKHAVIPQVGTATATRKGKLRTAVSSILCLIILTKDGMLS